MSSATPVPMPADMWSLASASSGGCEEEECRRSLWSTLWSCASTLALYCVANWYDPQILDSPTAVKNFHHRCYLFFRYSVAMPLLQIVKRLDNIIMVLAVRKYYRQHQIQQHQVQQYPSPAMDVIPFRSLAIMTVCPIILPITPETQGLFESHARRHQYSLLTAEELKERCPLELSPDAAAEEAAAADRPQSTRSRRSSSSQGPPKYLYLDCKYSFHPSKEDLADRVVLLLMGLVPDPDHLEKVKARNHFQTTVTVAQGFGFLLGVTQRLTQHLPVSAAEAAACIFGFIIVVEVLLDFIVSAHFKYPLHLRLPEDRIFQFITYERPRISEAIDKLRFEIMLGMALLTLAIGGGAGTLYILRYWRVSRVSAIFPIIFFLLFISNAITLYLWHPTSTVGQNPLQSDSSPLSLILGMSDIGLVIATLIFSILGTILDWEEFHERAVDMFAWVFPHVSPN